MSARCGLRQAEGRNILAYYESVFIARQDIAAAQVEGICDAMTKVIEDNGGKVTKKEMWGLRSIAYKIKKNRKGHYVLFNIDAPSDAVVEMERQMRLNEDVLRCLTVKVDELDEEPSVILQNKGERNERGDRRGGRGRPDNRGDRNDRPAPRQEEAENEGGEE